LNAPTHARLDGRERWGDRVAQKGSMQGDKEKLLGNPLYYRILGWWTNFPSKRNRINTSAAKTDSLSTAIHNRGAHWGGKEGFSSLPRRMDETGAMPAAGFHVWGPGSY